MRRQPLTTVDNRQSSEGSEKAPNGSEMSTRMSAISHRWEHITMDRIRAEVHEIGDVFIIERVHPTYEEFCSAPEV